MVHLYTRVSTNYSLGGFFDVLHLSDFRNSTRITLLHFLYENGQTAVDFSP